MEDELQFTAFEIGMLTGILLKNWSEYCDDPCYKRLKNKLQRIAETYYKEED